MKINDLIQKKLIFIFTVFVLLYSVQGIGYGQTLTASTPEVLTEANSNNFVVTLLLEGAAWANISRIRNAVAVSGIDGVTIKTERYVSGERWVCTSGCGGYVEWGYWTNVYSSRPSVRRMSDTVLEVPLTIDGNNFDFDTDAMLAFTVEAAAIANYNGASLTATIPITTAASASAMLPLTEQNLGVSVVTLTLTGGEYAAQLLDGAVTVSGIAGVGVSDVVRMSATVLEVPLAIDGNNFVDFDTDATLAFTVAPAAIANYNGALTATIPVTAMKESVAASVMSPLTEATLNEATVTLTLIGETYEADVSKIRDAVTVTGIDGVTADPSKIQRLSGTEITVTLAFDGTDFDRDATLTFSVDKGAIAGDTKDALTAKVLVSAIKESVSASTVSSLTEATLNEATVTLTLIGETYEADVSKIRDAVTVTGIDGVTADPSKIQRLNGTEITVTLAFDGTDFDRDATLTFSVDKGAIAGDTKDALTAKVLVSAIKESVSASTVSSLTEATLNEATVTLTLIGETYEADVSKIRDAVTVTGIDGVTIETAKVQRLNGTEITVTLAFDGTDFDIDTALTFSVDKGAIVGDTKDALTAEVPVSARKMSVSASVVSPLTEATLNESTVTLTLTGAAYETDVSKIRDAVTVTGIDGVTIETAKVQRLNGTEITVILAFDGTDFDRDATLTFSVDKGAIVGSPPEAFTAKVSVTPVKESLSVVSPLTEATLNTGPVTLTLTGATYEQALSKISNAVTVSGITGVKINTAKVKRLSDRRITVALDFDGTNLDKTATLTFSVAASAITNYTGAALTAEVSVTPVKESVSASMVSPLTEATLNGSVVTLSLSGATYEKDIAKIRNAVTVSGIKGVAVDTATVKRLGDRQIRVKLNFDGTDFVRDSVLTLSVADGAITTYKGPALTTEVLVTASRGEDLLTIFWTDSGTDKIQRANLDGSNIEDLITQGLSIPAGIALDVVGGKMYWTDRGTPSGRNHKIQRANLDGSDVQDLVTQGLGSPGDIALDVEGGKMYWTDFGTDKIQRANLDGSNIEDLVTRTQGLSGPRSIALDVVGGKMYWTDFGTEKIQRANLDGSDVQDLVTQGLEYPSGIALDVEGGKMYWTDSRTDKIQRANLDGSNVEDLITQGLGSPGGIALDVEGGKMYWTDSRTEKIQRANLDGSNIEDLVTQGVRWPYGIALGVLPSAGAPPDTPAPVTRKEDVNGDGVVDVQDLVNVAQEYGKTGANTADVNGDEVVDLDDIILVVAAIDTAAAAAPAARAQVHSHFTAAQLQAWLTEARASGNTSHTYQKGIAVLEQLLALVAPEATALLANYPNPFNPETWIPYHLANDTDVSLFIYDVDGALVRELDLGHQRAGYYTDRSRAAYWDGRNTVGESVASGVYFYQFRAGNYSQMRKMVIVK